MPKFLKIKNPSFGFHDGELVEMRFEAEDNFSRTLMRLRGSEAIKSALSHIHARSSDDLKSAYAMVDDNEGKFLSFAGNALCTVEQAISTLETFRVMAEHMKDRAEAALALRRIEALKSMKLVA